MTVGDTGRVDEATVVRMGETGDGMEGAPEELEELAVRLGEEPAKEGLRVEDKVCWLGSPESAEEA